MIAFRVTEDPMGWMRAGSRRGQRFTPAPLRRYQGVVEAACRDAMRRRCHTLYDEPVVVEMDFYLLPPLSWSNKKRQKHLAGQLAYTGRYDIDNLAKAILDALNGVAFVDDRLVVGLHLWKRASETVGVDVSVRAYEPTDRLEGDRHGSGHQGREGPDAGAGAASPEAVEGV